MNEPGIKELVSKIRRECVGLGPFFNEEECYRILTTVITPSLEASQAVKELAEQWLRSHRDADSDMCLCAECFPKVVESLTHFAEEQRRAEAQWWIDFGGYDVRDLTLPDDELGEDVCEMKHHLAALSPAPVGRREK